MSERKTFIAGCRANDGDRHREPPPKAMWVRLLNVLTSAILSVRARAVTVYAEGDGKGR